MNVEQLKKLIFKYENSPARIKFLKMCDLGEKYYRNNNDIKRKPVKFKDDNPLKTADNRLSHAWHGLFVKQKVGYMFSREPNIDVGESSLNKEIIKTLGDEWGKTLRELLINASNNGLAWLHYWIENNKFQYGIVPTIQVIPIYSKDLKKRLTAVIRIYRDEDENGNSCKIYEYWDDKECVMFKGLGEAIKESDTFTHSFGKVPFIYFNNNSIMESDLYMYKDQVDEYDKTISGFANDLDDIQEILFILQGYGGEDLEEFMSDLKDFKAVKTDDKGDVRTVKAEIPVEARTKHIEDLKKAIFLFGMGVNPDKDSLGDSSGVALKFLYSLLELKAADSRVEFDCSIKVLIRAVLDYLGKNQDQDISITYFSNMITNDKEIVETISKSGTTMSEKSKTKKHPYVENVDEELEQIKKEQNEKYNSDYNEDENFGADVDE